MPMTFAQLRSYVAARYTATLPETNVDEHINEVYMDLARLFTADTEESNTSTVTVNGTETYAIAVDARRIVHLLHDIGASLKRLRSMNPKARIFPRSTGTPARWYAVGMSVDASNNVRQKFGLDPVPNAAATITVIYEPRPTNLSADSDKVKYIPEEYHELIGQGAIGLAAAADKNYEVARTWGGRYTTRYNEIMVSLGLQIPTNFPELAQKAGATA